jgi:hypothetical protein
VKIKAASALLLLVAGCAGLGQNIRITEMSPEEIAKYNDIKVSQSLAPPGTESLGRVMGLSCAGDGNREVSQEEALDQLKMKAAKLRASAVSNVACQYRGSTDWANNCWRSYTCIGEALR